MSLRQELWGPAHRVAAPPRRRGRRRPGAPCCCQGAGVEFTTPDRRREVHTVLSEEFNPHGGVKFVYKENVVRDFYPRRSLMELDPVEPACWDLGATTAGTPSLGNLMSYRPLMPGPDSSFRPLPDEYGDRFGCEQEDVDLTSPQPVPGFHFHPTTRHRDVVKRLTWLADAVAGGDRPTQPPVDEMKVEVSLGTQFFFTKHNRYHWVLDARALKLQELRNFKSWQGNGLRSMFSNYVPEIFAYQVEDRIQAHPFGFKRLKTTTEVSIFFKDNTLRYDAVAATFSLGASDGGLEVTKVKSVNMHPFYLVHVRPAGQPHLRMKLRSHYSIREEQDPEVWQLARGCTLDFQRQPRVRLDCSIPLKQRFGVLHNRYKEVRTFGGTVPLLDATSGAPIAAAGGGGLVKDSSGTRGLIKDTLRGADEVLLHVTVTVSKVVDALGTHWEVFCASPALEGRDKFVGRSGHTRELATLLAFCDEITRGLSMSQFQGEMHRLPGRYSNHQT